MSAQNNKTQVNSANPTQVKPGIAKVLGSLAKDLWVVILDIIAVNLSYYLALMIRFYVHNEFRPTVSYYLTDFAKFAPFYTVLCIAVFALLRLYNGMWRYAGINDMNRIIAASGITTVIQIAGTVIFVRRMPITYYAIGAILQFIFISIIRFVYRFIIVEHKKIASRSLPAVNVMIIGAGEIGRRVIKQLEDDSAYRPVCVIDNKTSTEGKTFDGIPVLNGTQFEAAATRYAVKAVFIADPALSVESRENIKTLCEGKGVELQDYTGYLSNLTGRVSLTALLEATKCPVVININTETREYPTGDEALKKLTDRYAINSVSANGSKLVIDLKENKTEAYAGYEAWLQKHKEETGEEVSYF
ncbi:MAG: hypothetical protein IKH01_07325 [Prevotella sp.]|nr:hypothetical protein [Prevotella sp.]